MIRRTRTGHFEVRIPPEDRDVLRALPGELRALLATDDPALTRLFPPAHPDDPGLDAEYRDLTRGELLRGRLTSLQVMEATIDAERLDEEQFLAWLGAVNDLRLVLGTRLDVTEKNQYEVIAPDDPRAPAFVLYDYLGQLEEEMVEALAGPLT